MKRILSQKKSTCGLHPNTTVCISLDHGLSQGCWQRPAADDLWFHCWRSEAYVENLAASMGMLWVGKDGTGNSVVWRFNTRRTFSTLRERD